MAQRFQNSKFGQAVARVLPPSRGFASPLRWCVFDIGESGFFLPALDFQSPATSLLFRAEPLFSSAPAILHWEATSVILGLFTTVGTEGALFGARFRLLCEWITLNFAKFVVIMFCTAMRNSISIVILMNGLDSSPGGGTHTIHFATWREGMTLTPFD